MFAMLLVSVPGLGAEYLVSPRGADSNPGTVKRPFRTIQRAANIVHPGDTVFVADGTYNECRVALSNSGTSSAPITFQSQNKWGAKIVSNVGCSENINVTGSWVVLKFLDISGGGTAGGGTSGGAHGIFLSAGTNHLVFGNRIHNMGNIASDTTNAMAGIFVQTQNDVIDSNVIFGVGRTGCISSCSLHNDHGMYIDAALGASGTIIQNNLLYDQQVGYDIQLFPGTLNNVLIINNTMDATSPPSHGVIGCIVQGTVLQNSRIANNICYNPNGNVFIRSTCCGISNPQNNVTIDHNVTTARTIIDVSSGTSQTNNITNASGSALFNNVGGNDYHLVSNSPAIGAGTSNGAPAVDFDGNTRGSCKRRSPAVGTGSMLSDVPNDYKGVARANPPCIGAFEYAP